MTELSILENYMFFFLGVLSNSIILLEIQKQEILNKIDN